MYHQIMVHDSDNRPNVTFDDNKDGNIWSFHLDRSDVPNVSGLVM